MPHRFHHVPQLFNDALAMLAVTVASLSSSVFSADDWAKAIGPYGGYFISLFMLGLFIMRDKASTKQQQLDKLKTEEATERRHNETLTLQKENSAQLMAITVESIKAHGKATVAIESVDRTLQYLTGEIEKRPCQRKP
jgi:hypothetical protein